MTEEWFENPMDTRQKMAGDPHRPTFHFLPPRNWMNDPNGLFYWRGKYHLFYQFNPLGPRWGWIHWGHASSPDLVHWQDHPLALTPEEGQGDDYGCWSGCVVDDGDVPTAVYTGFVNPIATPVLLARALDSNLEGWQKSPHNPVISQAPFGVIETHFRDPYVWCEGSFWKMVIGAGMDDGESAVLFYESQDLTSWQYQGPLFKGRTFDSVEMWECPNFFKLDDRYVLLVSLFPNNQGVYYYIGTYDGRTFKPEREGYFDPGPTVYAPHVKQFEDGRVILFAWLIEGRDDEAIEDAGWGGVQSLPHELYLDGQGNLASKPIVEITGLRQEENSLTDIQLGKGRSVEVPVQGNHLEIEALIMVSEGVFVLSVLATPDGSEVTHVRLHPGQGWAEVDTTNSSFSKDLNIFTQRVSLPDLDGCEENTGVYKLRVFVDGSVIEAWIDDRVSITARAYPTRKDATGLILSAEEGKVRVASLQIWEMEAIWHFAS